MRIVMATPDVLIDRRIIQEARVLALRGHEVIVIAMHSIGLPFFEWIGPIKVERIDPTNQDPSIIVQLIQSSRKLFVRRIDRSLPASGNGHLIKDLINRFLFDAVNKSAEFGIKVLSKVRGLNSDEIIVKNRILFYEPDIIHIHDLPFLKSGVIAKGCLENIIIYDAHEIYPEIFSLTPIQKRRLFISEKRLIQKCDSVITVNPFIAKIMSERYNIKLPEVILNAVEIPEEFSPRKKHIFLKEFFRIPKDHKILLFQGWLTEDRGLLTLLRALKKLPENIHLVYMGYGNIQPDLVTITEEENLMDRFHIKETIPQDDLLFWTSSADAGIIPYPRLDLNHIYCSPNKLFEFIEAGLPIIANDLPYLKQIVEGEGFGVVHKLDNEPDFIEAILEMFDEKLGGPARFKDALLLKGSKYSWKEQADKLIDIYKPFEEIKLEPIEEICAE